MRVLTVHNTYRQAGGEDMVFEAESSLLANYGNKVEKLVFENSSVNSLVAKAAVAVGTLYNFHSAKRLEKRIKTFKPHIIHVHNFFPVASPSIFYVANKLKIPVVLTVHNYRLICPSATLYHNHRLYERSLRSFFPWDAIVKGVYRESCTLTAVAAVCFSIHNLLGTWRSRVNRFILLSEFASEKFKSSRLRLVSDKLIVKPNFVYDTGIADGTRQNFYLFVGRLSEEKGICTLLEAAKRHHFNLTIIGDGPLRELVLQHAIDYTNITYLGQLDNTFVRSHMRRCTALIFPSVWYEGFPVVILEAFSTGTPVIASRIGSVAEIVEENITGLLFKPGDDHDLIKKIVLLHSNTSFAHQLGVNARSTYLKKYTPEKNYDMLMDIYKEVISEMHAKQKRSQTVKQETVYEQEVVNESALPKLTIGIPTYNGAARIERALNSIFFQKYHNIEIVISDNASTDETQAICARYIIGHPEIKYYRQVRNIGLVANFNFALSHATGKYFMWLADDDTLEPGILHKCVSFLEQNAEFVLVSGQVLYWKGDKIDYVEKDFNLTSTSPVARLCRYYYKVIYGGMFHGVMRTEIGRRIPSRNVFGNDFHFVASLGYLGKVKNFALPGYHKSLGGFSKDVHQCARALGESAFATRYPHFKIAIDAFAEVMYRSTVFSMPYPKRLVVAVICFFASFTGYYGRILPLTIAGKIKRVVFNIFSIQDKGSIFKRRSLGRSNLKVVN